MRFFARCIVLLAMALAMQWAIAQSCLNPIPPSGSAWTVLADEATDTSTGLIWRRCPEGQTWSGSACTGTAQTVAWAAALVLADGQSSGGWRLPNTKELQSMVDASCTLSTDAAANPVAFPSHPKTSFWSSTPGWAVNFTEGTPADAQSASMLMNVRLVRAGNAQADFNAGHGVDSNCDVSIPADRPNSALVENADGTVTDASTGLTWPRCAVGATWSGSRCVNPASTLNWQGALAAAATAGGSWRLPNVKELASLVDQRCAAPAVDGQKFPDQLASAFWSSTPGWAVNFADGTTMAAQAASTAMNVRLVRGGNAQADFNAGHGVDSNCDVSIPADRPNSALVENGDGTVTDSSTGLVWWRCAVGMSWSGGRCVNPASSVNWQGALAAAASAGGTWRLPNVKELASLVDQRCAAPAVDGQKFPDQPATSFWSATPGWAVDFADGVPKVAADSTVSMNVRLVRAGNAQADFNAGHGVDSNCDVSIPADRPNSALVENPDGTVTDASTGLVWWRCAVGMSWTGSRCVNTASAVGWQGALAAATSAGGDWRLPNVKELASLVDQRCATPAVDGQKFPDQLATRFWSSTPGWAVDFADGAPVDAQLESTPMNVRLVRGGNAGAAFNAASDAGRCSPDIPSEFVRANWLVDADGTATDQSSGLMWDRCLAGQVWDGTNCTGTPTTYTWQAALLMAKSATVHGQTGWMVPNVKELDSITDRRCSDPALHPEVFRSPPTTSWTGTPGWAISSADGALLPAEAAATEYTVRLVRATGAALVIAPPVLIAPGATTAPGPVITTLTPVFSWQAAVGATGYGLYIRDVLNNTLVYPNAQGTTVTPLTGNSLTLPAGYLVADRQYKWNMTSFAGGVEFVPATGTNPSRWFQTAPSAYTAPIVTAVGLSGIGQTSVTLSATSDAIGTGYWIVVRTGATAPNATQVKSGVNFAGVTVTASGSGAMVSNVSRSFTISGLSPGTAYDFYVVAADTNANLSATPVKVLGGTLSSTAAPSAAKFVFDNIADQLASALVPVRIRATDAAGTTLTGFNDQVALMGLSGDKLAPNMAKFAGGVAAISVQYFATGPAKILAQYHSPTGKLVAGESNNFQLTNPVVTPLYTVAGSTEPGASLYLKSSKDGTVTPTVVSDASGVFWLHNVPVGYWQLVASKAGYVQVCPPQPEGCKIRVRGNLTVDAKLRKPGRPVVVVPGMMGSTLTSAARSALGMSAPRNVADHIVGASPQLPVQKCSVDDMQCDLADQLQIYDPTMSSKGQSDGSSMGSLLLLEALQDAGFEVFPAPWDWRQSFSDAAKIYLKSRIEEARRVTGATKVDIVAHSMGGLVARSYIENPDTPSQRDNIDKFIMLGTPNNGATNAYYLMEGGDPLTLDRITTDAMASVVAQPSFYSAVANELWRTTHPGKSELISHSDDGDVQFGSNYLPGVTTKLIREFLQAAVPGGRDLLPTYAMLKRWTPTALNSDHTDYKNGAAPINPGLNDKLAELNRNFNFASQYGAIGQYSQEISVSMFLSAASDTLNILGTTEVGVDSTYSAGKPDGRGSYRWGLGKGDGTVLRTQALGPFETTSVDSNGVTLTESDGITNRNIEHRALLGEARCEVVRALQVGRTGMPTVAECLPASAASGARNPASTPIPAGVSIASIDIEGQYSGLLTATDGKRAGTTAGVGGIYEEIVNSGVTAAPYQLHIAQGTPVNGTYQLQLTSDGLLENTAIRVALTYLQPNVGTQRDIVRILAKPTPYATAIVQDNSATRWMTLVDPVKPPIALKTAPLSDLTSLTWTAPGDTSIAGYRIYYRAQDDERYQLLGQTVDTSFTSAIPWAGTFESALEFIVVSVNAAGVESPIRNGNSARNVSFVRASFTAVQVNTKGVVDQTAFPLAVDFVDRSDATAAIQSWAWDFNGDGVTDSTAQNPSFSYALPGNYSVTLQVATADGSTDTSTFQGFVNIRTVPDAPTNVAAVAGSTKASISFDPPVNDGFATISSYTVTCSASGQTQQSNVGGSAPIGVSGLVNGVAYTCTVTATNSVGMSVPSAGVVVTPIPPTPPVCTLAADPASIASGSSTTLTATCTGSPTAYVWTGGTCAGTTAATCTVLPVATTTYTAAGTNLGGTGAPASAIVTVTVPVFALTVSTTGAGTVTSNPAGINCGATCSANFASGSSVTLTAAPTPGNTFSSWSGYVSCTNVSPCTFNMPAAAVTLVANFVATPTVPVASLSPASLSFAAQNVGTSSAVKTVALTNTGNAALTITSIASANSVFAVTHNCGASLAASASCTLNVTFSPTTAVTTSSSILVTDNATGSPHAVAVSGLGVPAGAPICTLVANPSRVSRAGSSTLTASCTNSPTSYSWTGGTCVGKTTASCTVTPVLTTTYSVTGTNGSGSNTASATVTVLSGDITPILFLLLFD